MKGVCQRCQVLVDDIRKFRWHTGVAEAVCDTCHRKVFTVDQHALTIKSALQAAQLEILTTRAQLSALTQKAASLEADYKALIEGKSLEDICKEQRSTEPAG